MTNAAIPPPDPNKKIFDEYSGTYAQVVKDATAFAGQEHAFYLRFKARLLLKQIAAHFPQLNKTAVLDFGCGIGSMTELLAADLPILQGTDVSEQSIAVARERLPKVPFKVSEATRLTYADASFDIIFAVCVFHHIPPELRVANVEELTRVLKPGGLLIIMEHNPYNPGTQLVVRGCELDRDAVLLTKNEMTRLLKGPTRRAVSSAFFLFFPWDNKCTRFLEHCMRALPLGAQYVVTAKKL